MTREQLEQAGFRLDADAQQRLSLFVERLLAENHRLNLTGIRDVETAWRLHVLDSLALLPLLRESGAQRVADIGSGGGVPGLPLACAAPEVEWTLIDATRKKVEAMRRIATDVRLENVRALWGRCEQLGNQDAFREKFDALTARAVASLERLIDWSADLVRPGGRLWFFKSAAQAPEEIAQAAAIARRRRLTLRGTRAYDLPEGGARVIVTYERNR